MLNEYNAKCLMNEMQNVTNISWMHAKCYKCLMNACKMLQMPNKCMQNATNICLMNAMQNATNI